MSDRYEAVAVRKYTDRYGNEKSSFTNIGVAFRMRDRDGYSLRLHAMPAPDNGEYTILLFPPRPRDAQQAPQHQQTYAEASGGSRDIGGELGDEIPF